MTLSYIVFLSIFVFALLAYSAIESVKRKQPGMNFSVLIPIYHKENAVFFKSALDSIWGGQTLKPNEVVIVRDGPLNDELDRVIEDFSMIAPVREVCLPVNKGLGVALCEGVKACSYPLIARMDSDDIARQDRFEKQIPIFIENPHVDLVGSNIAEFMADFDQFNSYRTLPENHEQIVAFSKRRNPINHMTAVFRKEAVLNAGNYQECKGYEDYYLWARMILNGSLCYNLQENLIFARIGNGMLSRRQGFVFFIEEIKFQHALRVIGFLSRFQYLTNLLLRALPHLFPLWALHLVYKYLLRGKS